MTTNSPRKRKAEILEINSLHHNKRRRLNDENTSTPDDDVIVYCICRKTYEEDSSSMVQCPICTEWFHLRCINLTYHQPLTDKANGPTVFADEFKCPLCTVTNTALTTHNTQQKHEQNGNKETHNDAHNKVKINNSENKESETESIDESIDTLNVLNDININNIHNIHENIQSSQSSDDSDNKPIMISIPDAVPIVKKTTILRIPKHIIAVMPKHRSSTKTPMTHSTDEVKKPSQIKQKHINIKDPLSPTSISMHIMETDTDGLLQLFTKQTETKESTESAHYGNKCFKCGESGHYARNCTKNNGAHGSTHNKRRDRHNERRHERDGDRKYRRRSRSRDRDREHRWSSRSSRSKEDDSNRKMMIAKKIEQLKARLLEDGVQKERIQRSHAFMKNHHKQEIDGLKTQILQLQTRNDVLNEELKTVITSGNVQPKSLKRMDKHKSKRKHRKHGKKKKYRSENESVSTPRSYYSSLSKLCTYSDKLVIPMPTSRISQPNNFRIFGINGCVMLSARDLIEIKTNWDIHIDIDDTEKCDNENNDTDNMQQSVAMSISI